MSSESDDGGGCLIVIILFIILFCVCNNQNKLDKVEDKLDGQATTSQTR